MYKLSCKEISGLVECDHIAVGESPEEAEARLMEHGQTQHGEWLASLSQEEKEALTAKIKQRLEEQG